MILFVRKRRRNIFTALALPLMASVVLSGCAATPFQSDKPFTPKSAYPADPWVRGYADPDDCIGGEKLAAVNFDLPSYPRKAFRTGRQGWVILRLDIAASGVTENVRIERAVPQGLFGNTTTKAAKKWVFRPPAKPLQNCRVLIRYRLGGVSLGG